MPLATPLQPLQSLKPIPACDALVAKLESEGFCAAAVSSAVALLGQAPPLMSRITYSLYFGYVSYYLLSRIAVVMPRITYQLSLITDHFSYVLYYLSLITCRCRRHRGYSC